MIHPIENIEIQSTLTGSYTPFAKVEIDYFLENDLNIVIPYSNLLFALVNENYLNKFYVMGIACQQRHLVNHIKNSNVIKAYGLTHVLYDTENGNYQKTGINEYLVFEKSPEELWFIDIFENLKSYNLQK